MSALPALMLLLGVVMKFVKLVAVPGGFARLAKA